MRNLPDLTIEERIKLVEDIWDSIVLDEKLLAVSAQQRQELDRRLAQYKIDGERGSPASQTIERVRSRL